MARSAHHSIDMLGTIYELSRILHIRLSRIASGEALISPKTDLCWQ